MPKNTTPKPNGQDDTLYKEALDQENRHSTQNKGTSKRMTVVLPSETAEMLDILSKIQSVSLNEAIRRAISTESFIQNEIRNNKARLMIETPEGEKRELIFR
jgi:hypothetical protein